MTNTETLILLLHVDVQPLARALIVECAAYGEELCLTSSYRSSATQAMLYAQGRTAPGKIVTRAPPGYSWHEFRRAFDVAILEGGRATWPNDVPRWAAIGQVGIGLGLVWGGNFKTIVDRPHFEYHPGLTLADARAHRDAPPVKATP